MPSSPPTDIDSMKIMEMKHELQSSYGISNEKTIEKTDLVSALMNANKKKEEKEEQFKKQLQNKVQDNNDDDDDDDDDNFFVLPRAPLIPSNNNDDDFFVLRRTPLPESSTSSQKVKAQLKNKDINKNDDDNDDDDDGFFVLPRTPLSSASSNKVKLVTPQLPVEEDDDKKRSASSLLLSSLSTNEIRSRKLKHNNPLTDELRHNTTSSLISNPKKMMIHDNGTSGSQKEDEELETNNHNESEQNDAKLKNTGAKQQTQYTRGINHSGNNRQNNSNTTTDNNVGGDSVRNLTMVEHLNTKQKHCLQMATKQNKNIFITGPAGTGKSVVLKHIMATLKEQQHKSWAVTSSTGITAVALGGTTFHSFAGCGVPSLVADFNSCYNAQAAASWRNTDVLIIEEISMLSGEFLDHINDVVKKIRHDDRAMGGIQLIICGDFLQLPPIERNRKDIASMLSEDSKLKLEDISRNQGYAFQSSFWNEAKFENIVLDEVFRQSNNKFIQCLHEIRKQEVSDETTKFIRNCERTLPPNPQGIIPTKLYPTNKKVDAENQSELTRLPGKSYFFEGVDWIEGCGEDSKTIVRKNSMNQRLTSKENILYKNDFFRSCIAARNIELRMGAQVMLVKNMDNLANGSRGKVVDFVSSEPQADNLSDIDLVEKVPNEGGLSNIYQQLVGTQYLPVVEFLNGDRVTIGFSDFNSTLNGIGECGRRCLPLKLAWAISIHKSQGMTLDFVKVDLKGVFAASQVYVALSRASSEQGLELTVSRVASDKKSDELIGFKPSWVRCDPRALKFYEDPNQKFRLWNEETPLADGEKYEAPPEPIVGSLAGYNFVFTGEHGSYNRIKAEKLVKDCGGKVVQSKPSGRTHFLVAGTSLELDKHTAGNQGKVELTAKYKKATEIISGSNKNNLRIIDKSQFFALIKSNSRMRDRGGREESSMKKKKKKSHLLLTT